MAEPAHDLFGNPEPIEYPDTPGHRGVETSIAAAEAIAPKLGRLQRMVFDAVASAGPFGLTADECADRLELDRWSIQPRTSELRLKGKIVDSGLRRCNSSKKRAIVWTLPEFKREADNAKA